MDVPQEWMTRDNLGDLAEEEADAFNDETFGDGADWDQPDPMNAGDISDLASMTFGKVDVLQEARAQASSGDSAFPSLPAGDGGLLGGGGLLTPGSMLTPNMFKSPAAAPPAPSSSQADWSSGPAPGQQQQQQQQQRPSGSHVDALGGMGGMAQHLPPAQQLPQQQQQQQPNGPPPPGPPPGAGGPPGSRAMSLEDVERQMMQGNQQQQQQQQQMPHPGMQMPPPGMMPNGGMGMGMGMGMPPPHIIAQMQQHAAAMAMAQQQQPGMGGVPPQSLQGIMNEQARHRGQQQQQQGFGGGRGFVHSSQPRSDVVRNMSWTRMTAEEVNQILRLQNSMLRDAAATNVYSNMLAAKQGTRANFAGPRIEGRSIKLSEALEGALGKPAPRDLRRPRQLVQISRGSAADPSPPAEPTGGEGDVGAEGEGDGANLNNPKEISTLPRAVRLSVENGMVRMLNVQDIDKIPSPDPSTIKRRSVQIQELYGMFHVNASPGGGTIDADITSLNDCKFSDDVFFTQLLLVPKGCKLLLRSLHLLSPDQHAKMLSHILRCLLPIGYQSETLKSATEIEMLVQLLVKLVYSVTIVALSNVLQDFLKAYSAGGTHLLICTKLGALALAALLRRGHDEYMVEEGSQSDEDKSALMLWASTCQNLILRCHGGIEPLFNAATQGAAISAIPGSMIVDAEVMVDFLYELGANANQEQRGSICSQLAGIASKKGDAQVQEQIMALLQSLNWSM